MTSPRQPCRRLDEPVNNKHGQKADIGANNSANGARYVIGPAYSWSFDFDRINATAKLACW